MNKIVVIALVAVIAIVIIIWAVKKKERYIEDETLGGIYRKFPNLQGEPNVMMDDKYEGGGPGGIGFMDWDVSDDIRQDRGTNIGYYPGVSE